ncbi:MAG TPA: hypothetical protein VH165_33280 [Kofleriaceae bacterium]|nr:hypothetical protein [Kofleriaceae bacterium]
MARLLGPIVILLVARGAAGQPVAEPSATEPVAAHTPFDPLEKALPPGWTMLATGSELVFRHDKPCYVTGVRHDNPAPEPISPGLGLGSGPNSTTAAPAKPATPPGGGPLITLELRYHLEPRWTAKQLAAARAANARTAGDLRALGAKYRIDAIHHSKGRPLPANPDERARLDAYDSEHAKVAKRLVPLPRCSLGDISVFDGEDTYTQLSLEIDPPDVIPQAHKIIALMKHHCG